MDVLSLEGFWNLCGQPSFNPIDVVLGTRTGYPYLILFPHAIWAIASYRAERQRRGTEFNWITSLTMAWLCYGFGGTLVSDVAMGTPYTALSHPKIVPCWLVAWLLVWFSPGDICFSLWQQSGPVRWLLLTGEALDASMTLVGRASRAARRFPGNPTAPIVAGVLAGTGGCVMRYIDRVIISDTPNAAASSIEEMEGAVWRSFGYAVIWWWGAILACDIDRSSEAGLRRQLKCSDYDGPDELRLCLLLGHVIWSVSAELGLPQKFFGTSLHPFNLLARRTLRFLDSFRSVWHLGPKDLPCGWPRKDTVKDKTTSLLPEGPIPSIGIPCPRVVFASGDVLEFKLPSCCRCCWCCCRGGC
jgi:hypothetical protein